MICTTSKNPSAPKLPDHVVYFKEESISETLYIPYDKPNMERLLDVTVWPSITDVRLIETEKGLSYEGQRLTGSKLIFSVNLKTKVTYVAEEPAQPVHAAHFESLKSIFVVLPEEINDVSVQELAQSGKLKISPYVEFVHSKMEDKKIVNTCTLLLVDVQAS